MSMIPPPARLAAELAAQLPGMVQFAFEKAKSSKALTFFESEVKEIPVNGFVFQVRFAPSLANKPKPPPKREGQAPANPFENPEPDLFVADLSPGHFLVLNKFPVVREHSILVTRVFKEQTHILEQDDLAAAFDCINAYAANGRQLFAFFNSGRESGASQPHRHIQLLPTEGMEDGLQRTPYVPSWQLLTDLLLQPQDRGGLPFAVFADWLADPDAGTLHEKYLGLYSQAFTLIIGRTPTNEELRGPAMFSYNLGMTRNTIVLCPRTAEGGPVVGDKGTVVGRLSLNGTVLAGTALVKTRQELDALTKNPEALKNALSQIGLPPRAVI